MDSLITVGDFLTFIGSQTQRLVSSASNFENLLAERPVPEMHSDIDVIASLIVVPRSILKSVIRRPTSELGAMRESFWPVMFGITTEDDKNMLLKKYSNLLERYSISFSKVNQSLIKKDVCRTDVHILKQLWDQHLQLKKGLQLTNNSHDQKQLVHGRNNSNPQLKDLYSDGDNDLQSKCNTISENNLLKKKKLNYDFSSDEIILTKTDISVKVCPYKDEYSVKDLIQDVAVCIKPSELNVPGINIEALEYKTPSDSQNTYPKSKILNTNLCTNYQEKMCKILSLYSVCSNSDYAQGMSDILSPIFASVDFDESLSFWLFYCLLTGVSLFGKSPVDCFDTFSTSSFSLHSFYSAIDSLDMKEALWTIGQLLRLLDTDLYSHMQRHGLETLLVCYRWLLVWFKREFSFENVCRLWELVLCNPFCSPQKYVLFIAVSLLEQHSEYIIHNITSFDEMIGFYNGLAGSHSLEKTVSMSDVLFLKFKYLCSFFEKIPDPFCKVLDET